ncbi:rhodanese-like domain-containing protein [Castellaniella denitrificans]|uniref:Rhodanese-like domain-containing protein n=1 Tax=Castellaniella denitrificans TaxID=56119 RepID=A0ABT4M132_9BURK|nr:rhodanese-like domain-containing protein [Castellaniella denitrificans]MCZ4329018.1 rhodanese-like domain-containing protein [Castellaniella denitrificans]
MDFLLSQNNLWILLIALASGGLLLWPSLSKGRSTGRVALAEAIRQVNQDHGQFVDLRPADQFKTGAIPQSRNIPLDTLESHINSLPKDKPIVLVDAHGRDGAKAVAQLRKHGFDRVSCLEGGLSAWTEGGLPLKKS